MFCKWIPLLGLITVFVPFKVNATTIGSANAEASLIINSYSNSNTTDDFFERPSGIGVETDNIKEWVEGEDGFIVERGNAEALAFSDVTSTAGDFLGSFSSGFELKAESTTFTEASPTGLAIAVVPGPLKTSADIIFTNNQVKNTTNPSFWTVNLKWEWNYRTLASGDDPVREASFADAFPSISYKRDCNPPNRITGNNPEECDPFRNEDPLSEAFFPPVDRSSRFLPGETKGMMDDGTFEIKLLPSRTINGIKTTFPVRVTVFAEAFSQSVAITPEPSTILGLLTIGGIALGASKKKQS